MAANIFFRYSALFLVSVAKVMQTKNVWTIKKI